MTEEEVKEIEHEIMINEDLISRDQVITLIALKHLSKVENFHGAITRLNNQVKKIKPVKIKNEIAEVLDKISTEIKSLDLEWAYAMGTYEGDCADKVQEEVLGIIEKYKKGDSE